MANITSAGSGLWNTGTTWIGGIPPVVGDKVTINTGHIVTVSGICGGGDDTSTGIQVNGTLKVDRTLNSTLTCRGNLQILQVGTLDYGTELDFLPMNIKAIILLNDSVALSSGKYSLIANYGSKLHINGAVSTTNTEILTSIPVGGTTVTVKDVIGWKVGDMFCIGGTTSGTNFQQEDRIISAIVGNVITFTVGATYTHLIGARCSILTKNIEIKPINNSFASSIILNSNYLNLNSDRDINNLQLSYCGNNASWNKYGAIGFNGPGSPAGLYKYIKNISIYETQNTGIDIYNYQPNVVSLSDIIIYKKSASKTGMYTRQGSVVNIDRIIFMGVATGISSAWSHGGVNCKITDTRFVNVSAGFNNSSGQGFIFTRVVFSSCYLCAGFYWGAAPYFINCNFGYNLLYDGKCQVVFRAGANANITPYLNDCTFNTVSTYDSLSMASSGFKLFISNKNLNPSLQETYSSTGNTFRDNTVFKTGVASLRIEPSNALIPNITERDVFAPNNALVVVSGYIMKNTSYGSATLPSIELLGLGITVSTYTMVDVNNVWEQFIVKATQNTGTDGVLTLRINSQSGNVGAKVWVDGIVAPASVPVNSGDFGYWSGGEPAKLLASNFTSGKDVWGSLVSDSQLTGSMGELLSEPFKFTNVGVDEYITENAQSIGLNASTGRNIILRIYKAETPNIQIGPDIQMIEHTISSYTATINWTSLGTTLGYHILVASSGIQKATELIDLHSDKLENRVWSNTKALTVGKFIALK